MSDILDRIEMIGELVLLKLLTLGVLFGRPPPPLLTVDEVFKHSHLIDELVDIRYYYLRFYEDLIQSYQIIEEYVNIYSMWLDPNWNYRKSHVIVGSSSGSVTNYQIRIIVHYGSGTDSGEHVYLNGKCRADFGDIRFTADDKVTLLPYWIERKVDGDYAVFWVKIPYIPLYPDTTFIYVYYGNPNATTTSNGAETFHFYSDWESGTLEDWTIRNGGGGGYGEIVFLDGSYQLKLYAPNTLNRVTAHKSCSTDQAGYRIKLRHKTGGTVGDGITFGFSDGSSRVPSDDNPNNGYLFFFAREQNREHSICKFVNGTWYKIVNTSGSASGNTYYILDFSWYSTTLRAFINETQILNCSDTSFSSFTSMHIGVDWYDDYFDWIFVRRYIEPEPSHGAWGSEETKP